LKFNHQTIIPNFSCNIIRGDKIGIIGKNGSGKSTLIKIITGKLELDSGSVKLGTNLEIAYLDQMRSDINENLSVLDNISGGRDQIIVNGVEKHIMSYVQDFLFSPAQARGPVTALSGGERNRLLLAKLFTKPFNLLILDEPTNDLDMETLELLENILVEYQGTLLLVSHDRTFLNNVVSSTLVFEGSLDTPQLNEYVGGYEDWVRQRPNKNQNNKNKEVTNTCSTTKSPIKPEPKKKKLSYNEQRELDSLPKTIEDLELQIEARSEEMNNPDYFKKPAQELAELGEELNSWQQELDQCYQRWEELDCKKSGANKITI